VLSSARGLLDFVYYSQYEVHSETTLANMEAALANFHHHKDAFVKLGIRDHFNIPKFHSLLHYTKAIRRLGCLDGYNTETSERLHVDFTKNAYRASSRREYFAQMTTWLQRQEAIVRRSSYLAWLKALRELLHSNVARAHQVPLTPSARRVSVNTLTTNYGALALLPALNDYIAKHHPRSPRPHAGTLFSVYHKISILLPPNIHVANSKRICTLRASPAVPRIQDRRPVPAHFHTALYIEDEESYRLNGGLAGLHAGEVRALFRLPANLGFPPEPLAYVRCFCPFRTPDSITGLHPTSHSTRNNA
ncbi:hypothetical protein C8T65DRAFT_586111, partial [Cerioporus squamosus]